MFGARLRGSSLNFESRVGSGEKREEVEEKREDACVVGGAIPSLVVAVDVDNGIATECIGLLIVHVHHEVFLRCHHCAICYTQR